MTLYPIIRVSLTSKIFDVSLSHSLKKPYPSNVAKFSENLNNVVGVSLIFEA